MISEANKQRLIKALTSPIGSDEDIIECTKALINPEIDLPVVVVHDPIEARKFMLLPRILARGEAIESLNDQLGTTVKSWVADRVRERLSGITTRKSLKDEDVNWVLGKLAGSNRVVASHIRWAFSTRQGGIDQCTITQALDSYWGNDTQPQNSACVERTYGEDAQNPWLERIKSSLHAISAHTISGTNFILEQLSGKGSPAIEDAALKFLEAGGFNIYKNPLCFLVMTRPSEIHFDDDMRVSRVDGPALRWGKYKKYLLHGVHFDKTPKGLIEMPFLKLAEQETNVEIRRAVIRERGEEAIFNELKPKLIDHSKKTGNELFEVIAGLSRRPSRWTRMKAGDRKVGEGKNAMIMRKTRIRMLRYTCPSTDRVYYKFVPEETRGGWQDGGQVVTQLDTADKAQAWSHNFTLERYLELQAEDQG